MNTRNHTTKNQSTLLSKSEEVGGGRDIPQISSGRALAGFPRVHHLEVRKQLDSSHPPRASPAGRVPNRQSHGYLVCAKLLTRLTSGFSKVPDALNHAERPFFPSYTHTHNVTQRRAYDCFCLLAEVRSSTWKSPALA